MMAFPQDSPLYHKTLINTIWATPIFVLPPQSKGEGFIADAAMLGCSLNTIKVASQEATGKYCGQELTCWLAWLKSSTKSSCLLRHLCYSPLAVYLHAAGGDYKLQLDTTLARSAMMLKKLPWLL